jgi:alginate O-acetyltransferase complex protein AlgF
MLGTFMRHRRRALTVALCAAIAPYALAQSNGRLYDPEPPTDSAYVRVIVADSGAAVEVQVDGKARIPKLARQDASDYMVIPEGPHTLTLTSAGQPALSYKLDVVRGKSLTLAFPSLKADAQPTRFEDKGNTNKLKAVITAYHLDPKAGPITVSTADGSAKVFSDLAPGQSASLPVNPIKIELAAAEGKATPVKFRLEMSAGATYSVLLTRSAQGKLQARTLSNKTERYVGP